MLASAGDKRVRAIIFEKAQSLCREPDKQGKALLYDLAGYRSLRAAGQLYRIIYKVESSHVVVYVVAVGIRKDKDSKDIYELARKIIRAGL
ncbi:MAG: type II toxin-antitoxin system RelE/ParE family toxin [Nitrospinae bacterium]|nr:type II toxin-antitoxin system RelE/ParE family toxin [Nitrospinota bacterium]